FEQISFDLGPTLAAWMEQAQPDVYRTIVEADRRALERDGVGNAMAQAYNHTILPPATARDQRTQILLGLLGLFYRFVRRPAGVGAGGAGRRSARGGPARRAGGGLSRAGPREGRRACRRDRAVSREAPQRAQHHGLLLQWRLEWRRLLRRRRDHQRRRLCAI